MQVRRVRLSQGDEKRTRGEEEKEDEEGQDTDQAREGEEREREKPGVVILETGEERGVVRSFVEKDATG